MLRRRRPPATSAGPISGIELLREVQEDGVPILQEFFGLAGFRDPAQVEEHPAQFLYPLDFFLRDEVLGDEDPENGVFAAQRLAYFIGHYLNVELDGEWYLEASPPGSRPLLVVGRFKAIDRMDQWLAPVHVATAFVHEPPGRDLAALVHRLVEALRGGTWGQRTA
jgi:hypothetical protein